MINPVVVIMRSWRTLSASWETCRGHDIMNIPVLHM